ncbi:hypothetical protein EXU57_23150 [Segetibacter sp. 3557_3]|uniref:hypothetical protein n=1 Tax=Segetibacter sp. 3557_3 TaxID=2547429 RepID=UPI001058E8FD|nr:hypothetical protein [Segetibacter sp. 3557_3]TDH18497.1 hypothetical protein EXU57_23150 [Segetibacter sp. 3557_3]
MSASDAYTTASKKPGTDCNGSVQPCPAKGSKCAVEFRPKDDWKGEYGFDWLRVGGTGEKQGEEAYKDILTGGYKKGSTRGYTPTEAYGLLKGEYKGDIKAIKLQSGELHEYFVPYLNLYPKNTPGTPTPPFEAELKILTTVKENSPEKIELEYNTAYFTLNKETLSDKAVGNKRVSLETLKITCIAEYVTPQQIKAWSLFEGTRILAGIIKLPPNSSLNRRELKLVLIDVKTYFNDQPGNISEEELRHLHNTLHQVLIHVTIEYASLDLTDDKEFRINGQFIYKHIGPPFKTFYGTWIQDRGLVEDRNMFQHIRKTFFSEPKYKKYESEKYFTIFCFNHFSLTHAEAKNEAPGVQNVVLFTNTGGPRLPGILSHEVLHGLGLHHTHKQPGPILEEMKYLFKEGKTDNIMSYNDRSLLATWRWQWEIIRKHLPVR